MKTFTWFQTALFCAGLMFIGRGVAFAAQLGAAPSSERIEILANELSATANGQDNGFHPDRIEVFASDTGAYLGCLSCPQDAFDALRNPNSLFATRLKNEASQYRDRTGDLSMCARLAANPPVARFVFGFSSMTRYTGRASMNRTLPGSICSYDTSDALGEICRVLESVCSAF